MWLSTQKSPHLQATQKIAQNLFHAMAATRKGDKSFRMRVNMFFQIAFFSYFAPLIVSYVNLLHTNLLSKETINTINYCSLVFAVENGN